MPKNTKFHACDIALNVFLWYQISVMDIRLIGSTARAVDFKKDSTMKTQQLVSARCYVTREGDWYVAKCIDFSLVAQEKTSSDALWSLTEQVIEYIHDAVYGEDKAHAEQLLARRSGIGSYLGYYYTVVRSLFKVPTSRIRFNEDGSVVKLPSKNKKVVRDHGPQRMKLKLC